MIKIDSSITHATHTYLYLLSHSPSHVACLISISVKKFCMMSVVVAHVGGHKSAYVGSKKLTRFCRKANHTAK